jgi:hypothetical protein
VGGGGAGLGWANLVLDVRGTEGDCNAGLEDRMVVVPIHSFILITTEEEIEKWNEMKMKSPVGSDRIGSDRIG